MNSLRDWLVRYRFRRMVHLRLKHLITQVRACGKSYEDRRSESKPALIDVITAIHRDGMVVIRNRTVKEGWQIKRECLMFVYENLPELEQNVGVFIRECNLSRDSDLQVMQQALAEDVTPSSELLRAVDGNRTGE